MKKITIGVSGMTCNHCEKRIAKGLEELKGATSAKASFSNGTVEVEYDEKKVSEQEFKKVVNDLGYKYKGILENNTKISRTTLKEVLPIIITILIIYIIVGNIAGFNFINFIPKIDKTVPLLMLFFIGLLTSIHCVGMCGSINLAVSVGNNNTSSIVRPLLYNVGRIISYTLTGAIVGGLGSVISFNGTMQGIVVLVAALFMLMMGLSMLGWLPKRLYKSLPRIPIKLKRKNNAPLIAGLLNGLMPCGPLQAMQLYALSTGSILLGALSMFIFSLGTIPLVFGFGLLFTSLKGKHNVIIQRISSVLVILLSLVMLNRSFIYLGIDISQSIKNTLIKSEYKEYAIAEIKGDYQYVEIKLNSNGYTPIVVQKGIPVVFNIKVDIIQKYGCTGAIRIPEFNIEQQLHNGDNLVKFTPTKTGDISYSCWMGMVSSNIKVVDDIGKIRKAIGE